MPEYPTKLKILLSEHLQILIFLWIIKVLIILNILFQISNHDAYRWHIQNIWKCSRVWWPHHGTASGKSRLKAKECDFRVVVFSLYAFTTIPVICHAFCIQFSGSCLIQNLFMKRKSSEKFSWYYGMSYLFYIQKCLRNNKQKYFHGLRPNLHTCVG